MTRQEIEQKMDELAREYHDTHDLEVPEEIMNWLSGLGRWNIEGAATLSGLAASQVLAQLEPLRHMRLSHDGTYEKD